MPPAASPSCTTTSSDCRGGPRHAHRLRRHRHHGRAHGRSPLQGRARPAGARHRSCEGGGVRQSAQGDGGGSHRRSRRGRDHYHDAADRRRCPPGADQGRRWRPAESPGTRHHRRRHEFVRTRRHAQARRRTCQEESGADRRARVRRISPRQDRDVGNHDRRRRQSRHRTRAAGPAPDGRPLVRNRRSRQWPRHEGAQQLRRRHLVRSHLRGDADRRRIRPRSRHDGRDHERLDGPQLPHRRGHERSRGCEEIRHRLHHRPARQGRRHRRGAG